ncbi:22745_t:CDS:1, partial [Rhizophagus irregularis]
STDVLRRWYDCQTFSKHFEGDQNMEDMYENVTYKSQKDVCVKDFISVGMKKSLERFEL